MKFRGLVIPSGNATGVEVPLEVMKSLGGEAPPAVVIAINGHSWRSRVALMRGQRLIGISAANRAAAGIAEGEMIEVELWLDEEPREVALPADLEAALKGAPGAWNGFEGLPFGLKRKYVGEIEGAKSGEARERRIGKLVAGLAR